MFRRKRWWFLVFVFGRRGAVGRWVSILSLISGRVVYRTGIGAAPGVGAATVVLQGSHVVFGVVDGRSFIFLYSTYVEIWQCNMKWFVLNIINYFWFSLKKLLQFWKANMCLHTYMHFNLAIFGHLYLIFKFSQNCSY